MDVLIPLEIGVYRRSGRSPKYFYNPIADEVVSQVDGDTRALKPKVLKNGDRRWTIAGSTFSEYNIYQSLKLNGDYEIFQPGDKVNVVYDGAKLQKQLKEAPLEDGADLCLTGFSGYINEWVEQMSNYVIDPPDADIASKIGTVMTEGDTSGVLVSFPNGDCYWYPSTALMKVQAVSISDSTPTEVKPVSQHRYVISTTYPSERMFLITSEEPLTPEGVMQRAMDTQLFDASSMTAGRRFTVCEVSSMHHVEVSRPVLFDVHEFAGV